MRYSILICLIGLASLGYAQHDILAQYNDEINKEQYLYDSYDGQTDGKITLNDSYSTDRTTLVYITRIDSMQARINRDPAIPVFQKRLKLRKIKGWLLEPGVNRYRDPYWVDRVEIQYNMYNGLETKENKRILAENTDYAIQYYKDYKDKPYAYDVLKNILETDPALFSQSLEYFGTSEHLIKLIDEMVERNPIKMKRWVNTSTPMSRLLNASTNSVTRNFLATFNKHGRASKAYYMLDEITKGNLTIDAAHSLGQNEEAFRKKLMTLAIKDKIIGEDAVQDEMSQQSLKIVRVINDMHLEKDPKKRFKSIESLSAEEFYTLMVYTPDEIFTSTYNGFYDRFIKKLGDKDAYDFLRQMNFNKYRTFIRMAAGYNKLSHFLNTMSETNQKRLLTEFVSDLEIGKRDVSLTAAVDVADTFGSLTDQKLKTFFSNQIKQELGRVNSGYDKHGIRIYSLLNVLLAEGKTFSEDWINTLVNRYQIPPIDKLDFDKLKNYDNTVVQQVFFYDDDDGKASYNSFMPAFRNSKWKIEDKKTFVKMSSTSAQKVIVYANKPEHEYQGKADLRKHLRQTGESPSVIIHRGHSFYVDTTIKALTPNTKLVFLGSCGGYHNLTKVLGRSPDVHIISSKQIGSMSVNDPLIRKLNANLTGGKDINWREFWTGLSKQLKGYSSAYKNFQDYVPPHQNLGAIFIMAYQKMEQQDAGI